MTIPSRLKIGGHWVDVEIASMPDDLDGDYEAQKLLIRINEKLPQSLRESTLIHEIAHVLNSTIDGEPFGHAFLDSFSEQFYAVLSDNELLR